MIYRHFSIDEFVCSHCGNVDMNPLFLAKLDKLREACGFPFVVTSGFRCKDHPIEAAKSSPGTHSLGAAADIAVNDGSQRRKIVEEALKAGFAGVGVASDFVHLDIRNTTPVLWGYG